MGGQTPVPGHGNRARYGAGCRCDRCTEANRLYHHKRKEWVNGYAEPPLADADEVRRQLISLRMKGVGVRTVADITGIARTTLDDIVRKHTRRVKPETALAVLALDADDLDRLPAGLNISARPTWRRIDRMREGGWTLREIALELGYPSGTIQFDRRRVTVENARRVRDLYLTHFGIRCAICGRPLGFHKLTEPCI